MANPKLGKTVNLDSIHLWQGGLSADTYTATDEIFQIRGGGGDDVLAGNGRSDIFIFEDTAARNGMDVITNFKVYDITTSIEDTLDLSLMFGSTFNKVINGSNVQNYVWVDNGLLYADKSGHHGAGGSEVLAQLTGVVGGDQLHIRTAGYDGMITATGPIVLVQGLFKDITDFDPDSSLITVLGYGWVNPDLTGYVRTTTMVDISDKDPAYFNYGRITGSGNILIENDSWATVANLHDIATVRALVDGAFSNSIGGGWFTNTLIVYSDTSATADAGIYDINMMGSGGRVWNDADLQLVGIIHGVGFDSLTSANFV